MKNDKIKTRIPSVIAIFILTIFPGCVGSRISYHGKKYGVIETDKDYWMAENLSTYNYRNGKAIPLITSDSAWIMVDGPACCRYNDSDSLSAIYGLLYNWEAVNTGKLCPLGWHVATDREWLDLGEFLGGENRAGGRVKSSDLWKTKEINGDDIGFRALPAGYRRNSSFDLGHSSVFWTSTSADSVYVWGRRLDERSNRLSSTLNEKENGFSVRCVRKK